MIVHPNKKRLVCSAWLVAAAVALPRMLLVAGASPGPCPTDTTITGYSDWNELRKAVEGRATSSGNGVGGTVTICPGTHFNLDEDSNAEYGYSHIYVQRGDSPVSIRCGLDGKVENDCVIDGGQHQFTIGPNTEGLVFQGLTFTNAYGGAVYAGRALDADITFADCTFKHNWFTHEGGYDNAEGAAVLNSYGTSRIAFSGCHFKDNQGPAGTLFVRYMHHTTRNNKLKIEQCFFEENKSTWASVKYGFGTSSYKYTGSAVTLDMASVEIEGSCFQDNDSAGRGTVSMTWDSDLLINSGNCFDGNTVISEMTEGEICNDIFQKGGTWDPDSCFGGEADTCMGYQCGDEGGTPAPEDPVMHFATLICEDGAIMFDSLLDPGSRIFPCYNKTEDAPDAGCSYTSKLTDEFPAWGNFISASLYQISCNRMSGGICGEQDGGIAFMKFCTRGYESISTIVKEKRARRLQVEETPPIEDNAETVTEIESRALETGSDWYRATLICEDGAIKTQSEQRRISPCYLRNGGTDKCTQIAKINSPEFTRWGEFISAKMYAMTCNGPATAALCYDDTNGSFKIKRGNKCSPGYESVTTVVQDGRTRRLRGLTENDREVQVEIDGEVWTVVVG